MKVFALYLCYLFSSLAAAGVWESTARAGGCSAAFPTPYRPPNPRSLRKEAIVEMNRQELLNFPI
jgi:hypothetical protein